MNPANSNSSGTSAAPQVVKLSSGPFPTSTHEMSQQQKIAAALTRAGITRPEAWAVAGVPYDGTSSQPVAVQDGSQFGAATLSVQGGVNASLRNANGGSDPDLTPPVVLTKGTNDPTFVISFRSQKEFRRRARLEIRRHGLGRGRHHARRCLHASFADATAVLEPVANCSMSLRSALF